jgi:LysR family transcriptional regulator for metE and metH
MVDGHRVSLRVTTSCYTSYHWLPAALTTFGTTHPRIDIRIVVEATRRALEALIADEVDFVIVTDPPKDMTWARARLVSSELVVLANPRHPLLADRTSASAALRWGELSSATIFVHDISEHDVVALEAILRDAAKGERATGEVRKIPLTEALVELVRAGHGIGIVDRWMVENYLGRDLVALHLLPRARRTFYAVWRRANPRQLPMRELATAIARLRGASAEKTARVGEARTSSPKR